MPRLRTGAVALLFVIAAPLAACGARGTQMPDGAQTAHVVVTDAEVQVDPRSVAPGDLYLIVDTPGASIQFVERQAADGVPRPLTDEDVARLTTGDTQDMSLTGFDSGGCSAGQNQEDRGLMGPCGNVMRVTLAPGKYAVVAGTADGGPDGPAPRLVIIEALP